MSNQNRYSAHFGCLYPPNTIVDGTAVTDLKTGNKLKYRVIVGRNGLPVIQSHQSARTWMPSWEELISLAVAAGIDLEAGENPCH